LSAWSSSVAAVFQLHHLIDHLRRHGPPAAAVGSGDAGRAGEHLAELAFGHLLGGMAGDDVAGFVAEHAGELRLVFQAIVERAGDEDLAAGQREGVDGFGIVEQVVMESCRVGTFGASVDRRASCRLR
jgi:hypothetical protein